jgi:hypothetical protein
MSAFAITSGGFSELRPAYVGETSYVVVVVFPSSVAGQTFAGFMYTATGTPAPGTVTAAVSGSAVTLTLPGQSVAMDYSWALRRTDDPLNSVQASGVIEVSDPSKP